MRISRRSFLISSILGATAIPGYSRFLESEWLEVTRKRLSLGSGKWGEEIRVLHLSDLHASDVVPFELIERAILLGLEERPHFACLTGDYITEDVPAPRNYVKVLRLLGDALPAFACFGNHDSGRWVRGSRGIQDVTALRGLIEEAGIVCLHNEHRRIEVGGARLLLVGLGDLWSQSVYPERAFPERPNLEGLPTLVLAHNPDCRTLVRNYSWDLMLSGHTHGGQIVIPVIQYAPVVPVSDRRFTEGVQPWQGRFVHVTRGVGSILGIRLNCRPEVSILTLAV